MNKKLTFFTKDNFLFFTEGTSSILLGFGIFFSGFLGLLIMSGFIWEFDESLNSRIVFCLGLYVFLSISIILFSIAAKIRIVLNLKKNSPERYYEFLQADLKHKSDLVYKHE